MITQIWVFNLHLDFHYFGTRYFTNLIYPYSYSPFTIDRADFFHLLDFMAVDGEQGIE